MAQIDRYLKAVVSQRASDLHLSCGEPVRLRIDGDLVSVDGTLMTTEKLEPLLFEILSEEEKARFDAQMNLDKSYSCAGIGNFRVNIFYTRRGLAAVLRTIPSRVPTMEDLSLPQVCRRLCELPKGLVLVTGPTGSGKSTTLAAMLNYINLNHPYHILTVEDPVEFVHLSQKSLINQREIGTSCHTFSDALRYALREDPDVILIGEMRDLETISLALTAAETGHLVFGTLHTRGAAASVDRIIDSFPAGQQAMVRTMLSESLAAVISQSLIKRADGKGRVAAFEIMVANHAISNLIREGKTFQITSIIQTGRKEGMVLMEQYVRDLILKGIVTQEEAATYVPELSSTSVKPVSPRSKLPSPRPGGAGGPMVRSPQWSKGITENGNEPTAPGIEESGVAAPGELDLSTESSLTGTLEMPRVEVKNPRTSPIKTSSVPPLPKKKAG